MLDFQILKFVTFDHYCTLAMADLLM